MQTDEQTAALLFDLDVCDSIFRTLAIQLENNATISDYHPLAVLAQVGVNKINRVFDTIDRGGMGRA